MSYAYKECPKCKTKMSFFSQPSYYYYTSSMPPYRGSSEGTAGSMTPSSCSSWVGRGYGGYWFCPNCNNIVADDESLPEESVVDLKSNYDEVDWENADK